MIFINLKKKLLKSISYIEGVQKVLKINYTLTKIEEKWFLDSIFQKSMRCQWFFNKSLQEHCILDLE